MADTPAWASAADFLGLLSPEARSRVLVRSRPERLVARTLLEYNLNALASDIIQDGVVRVFWTTPDGRQASISYLQTGELLGAPVLVGAVGEYNAQLVTDCQLLRLDERHFLDLFEEDLEVARAVAKHLGVRLVRALRLVTVRSLGSMRDRICYDLLERACREQLDSGRLACRATHEEMASSIGSSREVVTRLLGELRQAGIVETAPGAIEIVDAERLSAIVHGYVS